MSFPRLHWNIAVHEIANQNKRLRIKALRPVPSGKKRRRAQVLWPKVKLEQPEAEQLGDLALLGTDNLHNILSRLDVNSLHSCLRVNKTLLIFITSPGFRRSWRCKVGVIIGSRTRPWVLIPQGEETSVPFQPLDKRCPGQVLASSAGLLCINMHPTNDALDLAVGNPLTQEWVQLPALDHELKLPPTTQMSFRMEASASGHFKVAAYERAEYLHRVFVYDSGSDSWGVTELHYPRWSDSKWSDYDLTRGCWRTNLISSTSAKDMDIRTLEDLEDGLYYELSHPIEQGFCVWTYKSTSYIASPWVSSLGRSFKGFGVWHIDEHTRELSQVSAVLCREIVSGGHEWSTAYNNISNMFISCNASQHLACFMGESPVHPAVPLAVYDMETDKWTGYETLSSTTKPVPILGCPVKLVKSDDQQLQHVFKELVKAYDHVSVALVYSPSLLAPARTSSSSHNHNGRCTSLEKQEQHYYSRKRHRRPPHKDDYSPRGRHRHRLQRCHRYQERDHDRRHSHCRRRNDEPNQHRHQVPSSRIEPESKKRREDHGCRGHESRRKDLHSNTASACESRERSTKQYRWREKKRQHHQANEQGWKLKEHLPQCLEPSSAAAAGCGNGNDDGKRVRRSHGSNGNEDGRRYRRRHETESLHASEQDKRRQDNTYFFHRAANQEHAPHLVSNRNGGSSSGAGDTYHPPESGDRSRRVSPTNRSCNNATDTCTQRRLYHPSSRYQERDDDTRYSHSRRRNEHRHQVPSSRIEPESNIGDGESRHKDLRKYSSTASACESRFDREQLQQRKGDRYISRWTEKRQHHQAHEQAQCRNDAGRRVPRSHDYSGNEHGRRCPHPVEKRPNQEHAPHLVSNSNGGRRRQMQHHDRGYRHSSSTCDGDTNHPEIGDRLRYVSPSDRSCNNVTDTSSQVA